MIMASNSTCMKKYLFKLLYNISNMCYLYSMCCVCYSINSFLETERGKKYNGKSSVTEYFSLLLALNFYLLKIALIQRFVSNV